MMNQTEESNSASTKPDVPEPLFEDDDPVMFHINIEEEVEAIVNQRDTVYTETGFPDD